ncbi:MAG: glycosyltransferase family 2 protein [Lachnospiraceae bacterium]
MENLYIVIPAYNEEETISTVARQWHQIVENISSDSRLVIVNDGSKDHTLEILQKLQKQLPQLVTLSKPNGGHGPAVLYGYHYALKHNADYIFQTDSDGQTLPEEFPPFWNLRHDFSAIIGHRDHRQDGISRVFVTKVLKIILLLIFKVRVPDANAPFRLMSHSTLKKHIQKIPKNYNLPNVMLSVMFLKNKDSVAFLPITFRPRQGGKNSINLRKITKIGLQAIRDFRTLRNNI